MRVLAPNDREPRKNEFGIMLEKRMAVTESGAAGSHADDCEGQKGMAVAALKLSRA
jgi:hypothetical protein